MASFQLVKSEVQPLTLDLATAFHNLEPSPTERELNPARLKMLKEKATAVPHSLLVTFHWAKAKLGNQWLRVNGQHSSAMLTELNGDFPKGLQVHVDEYEVDSTAGLALLFRQFDERKSGRSAADVSGAYQNLEPALRDVAKPVGKIGVEAINWYRKTVLKEPFKVGDEQYSLFNEGGCHKYLLWLQSVFSIKTPELRRVPVVAAMYVTFDVNEGEARKFWDQVSRGGVDYEETAPSSVLDKWLKDAKEGELKALPTAAEFYQGCIYAWNAYRESKGLNSIKADTRKSWLTPHTD